MRTTLKIDDRLFRLAKRQAAEEGTTLSKVVEDALRQALLPPRGRNTQPFHLKLKTVRGRLLPGVDLTDRDSLYERMEGRS